MVHSRRGVAPESGTPWLGVGAGTPGSVAVDGAGAAGSGEAAKAASGPRGLERVAVAAGVVPPEVPVFLGRCRVEAGAQFVGERAERPESYGRLVTGS